MLYLIIFGLDFYSTLLILLEIMTGLSIFFLILAFCAHELSLKEKSVQNYIADKNYVPKDVLEETAIGSYKFAKCIMRKGKWMLSVIILTIFAPSTNSLYTALGVYVGKTLVENTQESPLVTKAYTLLSHKIDEMLDEQVKQVKSTKKETNNE